MKNLMTVEWNCRDTADRIQAELYYDESLLEQAVYRTGTVAEAVSELAADIATAMDFCADDYEDLEELRDERGFYVFELEPNWCVKARSLLWGFNADMPNAVGLTLAYALTSELTGVWCRENRTFGIAA